MKFNYQPKSTSKRHLTFSDMDTGDIFKLCHFPTDTLFIAVYDTSWGTNYAVNLATGEDIEIEDSALVIRLSSNISINYTDADLEEWV